MKRLGIKNKCVCLLATISGIWPYARESPHLWFFGRFRRFPVQRAAQIRKCSRFYLKTFPKRKIIDLILEGKVSIFKGKSLHYKPV